MDCKEMIEELEYAMWDAQEYISANEIPLCDYKIFRSKFVKLLHINQSSKEKFQNAVRHITVLNTRNRAKSFKILDVLKMIQDNLRCNSKIKRIPQKTMINA